MISSLSRFGASLPAYSTKPASSLLHARTTVNNPSTSIQRQGLNFQDLARLLHTTTNAEVSSATRQESTSTATRLIRFYIDFLSLSKREREALINSWKLSSTQQGKVPEGLEGLAETYLTSVKNACLVFNAQVSRYTESTVRGKTFRDREYQTLIDNARARLRDLIIEHLSTENRNELLEHLDPPKNKTI